MKDKQSTTAKVQSKTFLVETTLRTDTHNSFHLEICLSSRWLQFTGNQERLEQAMGNGGMLGWSLPAPAHSVPVGNHSLGWQQSILGVL